MAHIYMQFDFAGDEEKAQLARHKLEVWKQAFRLDKKLLYKFERSEELGAASEEPKSSVTESPKLKGKSKAGAKHDGAKPDKSGDKEKDGGNVHLLVRLGFSGHEKLSEHRWVERIPTEEPFITASPVTIKPDSEQFADIEKRFEELE
jgi:hypothetical protein